MQQILINIKNKSKAKKLIDFLKQLDFLDIEEISIEEKISIIKNDIIKSVSDLKQGKVSSWKNKKISLKNA